jgi:hypothetical protein
MRDWTPPSGRERRILYRDDGGWPRIRGPFETAAKAVKARAIADLRPLIAGCRAAPGYRGSVTYEHSSSAVAGIGVK